MKAALTIVLFLLSCAILGSVFKLLGVPLHWLAAILGACVVTAVMRTWLIAKIDGWQKKMTP